MPRNMVSATAPSVAGSPGAASASLRRDLGLELGDRLGVAAGERVGLVGHAVAVEEHLERGQALQADALGREPGGLGQGRVAVAQCRGELAAGGAVLVGPEIDGGRRVARHGRAGPAASSRRHARTLSA